MLLRKAWVVRHISDYGMLAVLGLLCLFFSLATLEQQTPRGAAGGQRLAREILKTHGAGVAVFAVTGSTPDDVAFVGSLQEGLAESGKFLGSVQGQPSDARKALGAQSRIDVIAVTDVTSGWSIYDAVDAPRMAPRSYLGSNFLKRSNILNVAGQIAIIAVIAIGMTFVIITAGIDLSVGSLIALSAVIAAWSVRELGGSEASIAGVVLACGLAILVCAAIGSASGFFVAICEIPPFIVTLAVMLIARGAARLITGGQTIAEVPDGYPWLGREATLGIPNAAILMVLLYVLAHLVLSKTKFGRYVYATGGNPEAARLSGVPIRTILVLVYTGGGALAGLGGVMMSSQLSGGSHEWGKFAELDVIAAVVVGGASLMGGEGRMLGTLIGALIIAVIQNGMNLLGLNDAWQPVVMGSVILLAVLLDRLKKRWVESMA